jgi:hypothetical protein
MISRILWSYFFKIQEKYIILAPSPQLVKVGLNFQTIREPLNWQNRLHVICIHKPNEN